MPSPTELASVGALVDAIAHAAGIYGGRRTVTLLDKPAPDRQCAPQRRRPGSDTSEMTNVAPMPRAGATPAAPLIAFHGVSHFFGERPVLQDINLTIGKSEFVCMVGPSGCGKTTMLRMVGGLQAPAVGEVTFAGKRVAGPAQEISFMFQDYSKALAALAHRGRQRLARARGQRRAGHATRRRVSRTCWVRSASPATPSTFPPSSPAACSNACRSPAVSRKSPRCC